MRNGEMTDLTKTALIVLIEHHRQILDRLEQVWLEGRFYDQTD